MQECPLSLRRFLELTGFYSLWLIIIGGLWMRKWSFIGGLGMGSDCWWEGWGTRGGVEKGSFSFHVFSAVKNENKESSTVFKLNPCCQFFGSRKKGICVASSQILSPRGFICLCVATEASGLYRYSCCVYPWSCCLFIIRPPYCEDAVSVFKVSTTQSLSRYLNHSIPAEFCTHNNKFEKKAFSFDCLTPPTHLHYFLFLFHNIKQLLDPILTFSFN